MTLTCWEAIALAKEVISRGSALSKPAVLPSGDQEDKGSRPEPPRGLDGLAFVPVS